MASDTGVRPARRRGRPSKGELREERILDATRRLVGERSMADITIDEIAAAAGISRTSFYFYFPTKQAVLAALMDQVWERLGQTHVWFGSGGPSPDELGEQLRRVAGIWQENSRVLACAMPTGFAGGYPRWKSSWAARSSGSWTASRRRSGATGLPGTPPKASTPPYSHAWCRSCATTGSRRSSNCPRPNGNAPWTTWPG